MDAQNPLVAEYQDFFPQPLLRTIHETATEQTERKQTYQFVDLNNTDKETAPIALVNAARYARIVLRTEINTAILKRYSTEDDYVSRAYEYHTDPERFRPFKLVFCTIDGDANLKVRVASDTVNIDCSPNTAVTMDPSLEHKVTPPKNQDGIRHFLFLGHDYTVEEVL